MAATPRHLSLAHRKSLASLALTDRILAEFHVDSNTDPARSFRNSLKDQIRLNKETLENNATPLDAAVRWLIDEASSTPNILGQDEGFDGALTAIKRAAASLKCIDCSGSICNGGAADDEIVATRGLCISEFMAAAEQARRASEHYYGTYSSLYREAGKPRLVFSTAMVIDRPHSYALELEVGGKTRFLQERSVRGQQQSFVPVSEVILQTRIRELNRSSVLASTYVLFHEFFCHAFQYLHPEDASRVELQEWDYFSEGWMDHLAIDALEEICTGKGAPDVVVTSDQLAAGKEVHLVRSNPYVENPAPHAAKIRMGVDASRETRRFLTKLLGEAEGREAYLALSLDLNLMNRSPEDPDRVVEDRHRVVNMVRSGLTTKVGKVEVCEALCDYAYRKDSLKFFMDIKAISFIHLSLDK